MPLQENTFFHDNRYRLIKLLGSGGFSEVWLVEDTKVGNQKRALKVYAPGKGLDDDGVKLFSDEFQLVYDLNNSHLLRPSHFDVCDRSPYLVMPFCERGSASKLIGKISEEQAWHFLHDVAAGLAYLHEQEPPIIHQDIKPDNVLIDKNGKFLITDFGISTKARSTLRKSMGDVKKGGTIAYMAPERFGKDKTPIKASDIWSLGATMFELLTDDAPFGDHGGLIQKSGAEISDISDIYSQDLREIVYKMIACEPWERPTAAQLEEWTTAHFKGEKIKFENSDKAQTPPEPAKQQRTTQPYTGAKKDA
ncbi:MAG: serine/threonine protein kinase, partial [Bacteroidales bacterium]|nr:serine/threonine protein kinase [Bacteroidales bacterium]